jgi:hypothetical protein
MFCTRSERIVHLHEIAACIWRTILAMLNANPGVACGGFGEYWLGSCYTDSMLSGIRRETGADDGSIAIRRSLNGLAANPRMARRDWYEQQIRSDHPDRDSWEHVELDAGFNIFAAPGQPIIDAARVKADVTALEVVIARVNAYITKTIAHRDDALGPGARGAAGHLGRTGRRPGRGRRHLQEVLAATPPRRSARRLDPAEATRLAPDVPGRLDAAGFLPAGRPRLRAGRGHVVKPRQEPWPHSTPAEPVVLPDAPGARSRGGEDRQLPARPRSDPGQCALRLTPTNTGQDSHGSREPAPRAAEQARELCERAAAGERKSLLAKEFGISRETVYSYLRTASAAGVAG